MFSFRQAAAPINHRLTKTGGGQEELNKPRSHGRLKEEGGGMARGGFVELYKWISGQLKK